MPKWLKCQENSQRDTAEDLIYVFWSPLESNDMQKKSNDNFEEWDVFHRQPGSRAYGELGMAEWYRVEHCWFQNGANGML